MSRQSDQLEILHNKLSHRYGPGDKLCTQVFAALESCRKFEPAVMKKHDWSISYKHMIVEHHHKTPHAPGH